MPIPPEQAAMSPFLQGWLAQTLMMHAKEPDRLMKIAGVHIPNTPDGTFVDHFIVVFESGAAAKVTVEAFDQDAAEVAEAIRSILGGGES